MNRGLLTGFHYSTSPLHYEEAKEAGIGWRTVERAKAKLGVISYREGQEGRRGGGQSFWKLSEVYSANPPKAYIGGVNPESPEATSMPEDKRSPVSPFAGGSGLMLDDVKDF